MKLGISLTPGGLLLPYHLGVLDSLEYNGILTAETPIAGSSAGAIATACHACGVNSHKILDLTIDMSAEGAALGGARGRLMPLLRRALDENIGETEWRQFQERPGLTGIAYRQIFPTDQKVLQTQFSTREDLINSVCYSSMFPFFTSNWPATIMRDTDGDGGLPRLAVDGFFTVPRERFGAPYLDVDRTVAICPFSKDKIRLDAFDQNDCISPDSLPMVDLLRLATEGSDRTELTKLYETGYQDGEQWCRGESSVSRLASNQPTELASVAV